jgi:hypothetical protein
VDFLAEKVPKFLKFETTLEKDGEISILGIKSFELLIDFSAPSLIYIDKITLDIKDIVFSLEGYTTLYIGTLKYQ